MVFSVHPDDVITVEHKGLTNPVLFLNKVLSVFRKVQETGETFRFMEKMLDTSSSLFTYVVNVFKRSNPSNETDFIAVGSIQVPLNDEDDEDEGDHQQQDSKHHNSNQRQAGGWRTEKHHQHQPSGQTFQILINLNDFLCL